MTDGPTEAHGLMGALLAPLRAASNIETIASALLALKRETHERLTSVDEHVSALLAPLNRIDRNLTELQELEQAIQAHTDAIRDDINTRLLTLEAEVRAMRTPIEGMSRDLATVVKLLPNPSDGPLARLRDTLSSS